ncbi:TonB-linked SusC/RagA family outer membrane protein [Arcicella aurantiaca]|uniref:TonB-linked SusC/RagA family outer membrane protein n=1 Tax=Arcicella aurantiaca TaxID=591202 RepID=A0A316EWW4_9BACT|nr:TonB-dependent receptor [Arcicella aurantiaca]PWK27671.1 TonB-linked SusC/RagA family outer membrane protein [Arcicella aurantiaca]
MKKNQQNYHFVWQIMKLTFYQLCLIIACMNLSLALPMKGQEVLGQTLSLKITNQSIKEVLHTIEKNTDVRFVYSSRVIDSERKISISFNNVTLGQVLHKLLTPLQVNYEVAGKQIVLASQNQNAENSQVEEQVNAPVDVTVAGKVYDENNKPLPGVNIAIKGTRNGTTTNADGSYKIAVPDKNAILVFSFVGYAPVEKQVGVQTTLNVQLNVANSSLEEVVVIGYGAVKKKDLTGAVVQLKSEQLKEVPTANVLEAAQGKIAGADITRSSGQAGARVNINIRGNRSIGGSNSPLIIVDGIQYNNLEDINANDIETMDVLKDASSIAIYGSRGANGVILITTKKGKSGKTDVSFNTYSGVSQVSMYPRAMNMTEYRDLKREAWRAAGLWKSSTDDATIFANVAEYQALQNGEWTDFQKELIHNGFQQNYQIGVRTGTERLKSYISLDYFNEKGILKLDDIKRYTGRLNVDYTLNDWMKIGLQSQITYYDQSVRRDPLNQANKISPLGLLYDANGNFNFLMIDGQTGNPLSDEQPNVFNNTIATTRSITNGYLEFTPLKGLTIRSLFGANLSASRNGLFQSPKSLDRGLTGKSLATYSENNSSSINWENVITYQKAIGLHNFTLTGVGSYLSGASDNVSASGVNQLLPSQLYYALGNATEEIKINSGYSKSTLLSYAARLNYAFNGKYLLTVTARQDGSSKLAEGNKWTFFPSVAFAWRAVEEDFMKNIPQISDLKLRLSYGIAGNDPSGPYATQSSLTRIAFGYDDVVAPAYTFSRNVGNAELGWELSETKNLGLDFGILEGRISGSVDYYDTKTTNLLLDRGLPPTSGVTTVKQNIGKTRNQGIEVTIGTTNIRTKNFSWNSNITFTKNNEEIVELVTGGNDIGNGWFIGQPINVFYDYQKTGIWQTSEADVASKILPIQTPGEIKVMDQNGDSKIDAINDRVILGNPRPKWSGGLDNTFKFKNFDLNVFIYARMGQMINADRYARFDAQGAGNSTAGIDYWTPENPTNAYPRPNKNGGLKYTSTLGYQDGSFARIRNITLGYNIPATILRSKTIKNIKVYVTGKNLFTFSKLDYDPERGGSENFPMTKLFVFGLNVNL